MKSYSGTAAQQRSIATTNQNIILVLNQHVSEISIF